MTLLCITLAVAALVFFARGGGNDNDGSGKSNDSNWTEDDDFACQMDADLDD
ncbi:MAG: hypothetical protein J6X20_03190 [Bacteroidales bacterium]|nr:hypothetical protein [Bacteroidales bacterium]